MIPLLAGLRKLTLHLKPFAMLEPIDHGTFSSTAQFAKQRRQRAQCSSKAVCLKANELQVARDSGIDIEQPPSHRQQQQNPSKSDPSHTNCGSGKRTRGFWSPCVSAD